MQDVIEEDEDALNKYYIQLLMQKHNEKLKGRVKIKIPYRDAKDLKKKFDLYWNKDAKTWMCLEQNYDEITLLINEKAGDIKN
jgi:uncharacterized protein YneR